MSKRSTSLHVQFLSCCLSLVWKTILITIINIGVCTKINYLLHVLANTSTGFSKDSECLCKPASVYGILCSQMHSNATFWFWDVLGHGISGERTWLRAHAHPEHRVRKKHWSSLVFILYIHYIQNIKSILSRLRLDCVSIASRPGN